MLVWFSKKISLQNQLERWGKIKSNFEVYQPFDASWNVDGYERTLSPKPDRELFDAATQALFLYNYYPPEVLVFYSDFLKENRPIRVGDRILQRIQVFPGLLDVLAMNLVTSVIQEPKRRGFTYVTTDRHVEVGEWTGAIVQKQSGEISMMVHSTSKPDPKRLPIGARWYGRRLQLRAHRLGLDYFERLLKCPR